MSPPRPWWQSAVVYQVYPRSFQDTTGNGVGDLPGITRRLDYLADTLGVGAIWVSPFYPSPMADFGYDVSDYCDVDPLFGTLDDFDELIRATHARGLKLIIDWVPNHTSIEHPWFAASSSSIQDPKRDWYVWRDPAPDGSPPNNWQSVFGGSAWEYDDASGQFYLHSFLKEQPDLNWRNPEVEAAMLDTLRFWLDRGVDGFRIDVAHYVMKDPGLRDNPPSKPDPDAPFKSMGEYDAFDHIHDKGHDDVHRVFREIRALLDSYPGDRIVIGEIHDFDWARWSSYFGRDLDELHLPFNFSLLFAPWDAEAFASRIAAQESVLPEGAWPNHVLGNHDESRIASRFGPTRARVAAVLLLTLRGTPTLYYGDELGIPQAEIPPERQQDPWGRNVPGLGRDGCRTPMQWDAGANAGFAADGVTPWLTLTDDHNERNVEVELTDPSSMLALYRRLLQLRRQRPTISVGDYRRIDAPEGVLIYLRSLGDTRFAVALNFTAETVDVEIGSAGSIEVSTHLDREGTAVSGVFELYGDEAVVIALR